MPTSSETGRVVARDVGKRYVLLKDERRLLGLSRHAFRSKEYLWALRHVSLDLAPGESIGVIGPNGSGKSTLLRVVAGVTAPTEGSLEVGGRVASLITIGAGFHPELTGRENIVVGGIVLGLSKAEIDARFDEIVAFSGLATALDRPVKHYSSGMFMRLGFSVAIYARPDVLLIDEVLAVGDHAFRERCYERVRALQTEGVSLFLVSHSMPVVELLCPRAVVLSRGLVTFEGPVLEAVDHYHALLDATEPDRAETEFEVDARAERVGGGAAIDRVAVVGDGGEATAFASGAHASIRCRVSFETDVHKPRVTVAAIFGGQAVYVLQCDDVGGSVTAGEALDLTIDLVLHLGPGSYRFVVTVREEGEDLLLARARSAPVYVRAADGDALWWGSSDLRGSARAVRAKG
ncbi:MAG: polysaccharide ABC transporter ATP-binding protein [Actinomycetota bacterium]